MCRAVREGQNSHREQVPRLRKPVLQSKVKQNKHMSGLAQTSDGESKAENVVVCAKDWGEVRELALAGVGVPVMDGGSAIS